MRPLTPFKLALVIGCGIECLIVSLALMFGRFGPCTPTNLFTWIFAILQLPGFLLAAPIGAMDVRPGTEGIKNTLAIAIMFSGGCATFTGLVYLFTRRMKRFKQ